MYVILTCSACQDSMHVTVGAKCMLYQGLYIIFQMDWKRARHPITKEHKTPKCKIYLMEVDTLCAR